jgi:hypothetical protein
MKPDFLMEFSVLRNHEFGHVLRFELLFSSEYALLYICCNTHQAFDYFNKYHEVYVI